MRTKNVSTQEPYTGNEIFEQVQKITQIVLPKLNDRIADGKGCVYEIPAMLNDNLSTLVQNTNVAQLSREMATEMLRCIAPIASSTQRHLVTFGHEHNHFSQLYTSDIDSFLEQLGKRSFLSPRDSHYTTWLLNTNPTYTFDTNPGWLFFHEAVRKTNDNNLKIFSILEEITNGQHYIASKKAEQLIREAFLYANDSFNFYKQFVKGGMAPEYFSRIFRTYFLEYTVGGKKYTGSNATNVSSVPAVDFKIGITDGKYIETVKNRFIHYTKEDINFVSNAIAEPSILQLIVEALGFDFGFFKYATPEELYRSFNRQFLNEGIKKVFHAVLELVHELSSWSKQHFGLINTFLVKEEQKNNECPLGYSSPAVSFSQGVGGASHEETKCIRDMRANNEIVKKLKLIIKP